MSDLGSAIRFVLTSDQQRASQVNRPARPAMVALVEQEIRNKRNQRRLIRMMEDVDKDHSLGRFRGNLGENRQLQAWATDPRNEALVIEAVEKFLGHKLPRVLSRPMANEGITHPVDG